MLITRQHSIFSSISASLKLEPCPVFYSLLRKLYWSWQAANSGTFWHCFWFDIPLHGLPLTSATAEQTHIRNPLWGKVSHKSPFALFYQHNQLMTLLIADALLFISYWFQSPVTGAPAETLHTQPAKQCGPHMGLPHGLHMDLWVSPWLDKNPSEPL